MTEGFMFVKPAPVDPNEIKNIWQIIIWNMRVHHITPEQLATSAEYSIQLIKKGINGEAALITDNFLNKCVKVFRLTNGRVDMKILSILIKI
jgi:hypothetical protein